jgi:hypothetical protein
MYRFVWVVDEGDFAIRPFYRGIVGGGGDLQDLVMGLFDFRHGELVDVLSLGGDFVEVWSVGETFRGLQTCGEVGKYMKVKESVSQQDPGSSV